MLSAQNHALRGLALWYILCLGACSFNGGTALTIMDASIADARADAATRICDKNNSDLALCLQFEDPDQALELLDDSQYGNDLTVTNAGFSQGHQGRGIVVDESFFSRIQESESLDPLIGLTVEMWLSPSSNITSRQWLFDNDGQWGVYLDAGGVLVCDFGPGATLASGPSVIVAGSWQHVACVYDGSKVRLYANARQLRSIEYTMDLRDQGTEGSCVGHDCPLGGASYIGQMDTLRIWRVGLDRLTLCAGVGLDEDDCPEEPSVP